MGKSKVICPICNKEFERATAKKKYCGPECQRLANIKHTREKQKQAGMTYGKYVGLMWQQEQKKERQKNEQRDIEKGERA